MLIEGNAGQSSGNAGRYVVRDGELVRIETDSSKAVGGVHVGKDMRVTDEQYKRHYELVRRVHFQGEPLLLSFAG